MPEASPEIYKLAPTTDRSARLVARKHGFSGVRALAGSLPENAYALELGAGASSLGIELAKRRPDVTVVNYDYSYHDQVILDEVSEGAPENISFMAGDATRLENDFAGETFQAVFSYWLFPHLSLIEPDPAYQAGLGVHEVTETGGLVCVGPRNYDTPNNPFKSARSMRITKTEDVSAETFAESIVTGTILPTAKRESQIRGNELSVAMYGTTRYLMATGRRKMIRELGVDGEYVPLNSVKGMKSYYTFLRALAAQAPRRR